MSEEEFRQIILTVLRNILHETPSLDFNVGERALVFRLGYHLQNLIQNYAVDSEYNYDVADNDPKKVPNEGRLRELALRITKRRQNDLKCVIPDLIIHGRTADQNNNIAVIEVKWADRRWTEDDLNFDREKLRAIKSKFHYTHAALILLPRDHDNFLEPENIEIIY